MNFTLLDSSNVDVEKVGDVITDSIQHIEQVRK